MNDEVVVRFGFEPRLFNRALMGWWRSAMPPSSFSRRVVLWALVWFGLLMLTMVLGALGIQPVYVAAALIGIAVFVVGFVVLQRVRMRQFIRVIGSHWDVAGETEGRFGPNGVTFTNAASRNEIAWAGIDAVVGVMGGTVLRSGVSMIAVPDRALPSGLTPRAFRERLEAWQVAAEAAAMPPGRAAE